MVKGGGASIMAVSAEEIEKGKEFLKRKGARRIILFGSALRSPETAHDLDIACEGITPEEFYAVAGEVSRLLNREVDLIELSDNTPFTRHVEKVGRVIYHDERT